MPSHHCLLQGVKDVLGGLGLGVIANQLADLQLGELLDTPPPGLDEAVAIAKVRSGSLGCAYPVSLASNIRLLTRAC